METGFTKGPWVVNPLCAQVDCGVVSDLGGLLPVCQLLWPTDERSEGETEANAHLIASAPDLYEALDKAVTNYRGINANHQPSWFASAEAALAKARGEQL